MSNLPADETSIKSARYVELILIEARYKYLRSISAKQERVSPGTSFFISFGCPNSEASFNETVDAARACYTPVSRPASHD